MKSTDRRFLVAVTLTFGLALLVGSFVNPLFRIPDERWHADMVLVAADVGGILDDGWPMVGDRDLGPEISAASGELSGQRARLAPKAVPRDERLPLSANSSSEDATRQNRMAQHPPLYYMVVAAGVGVLDLVDPGQFAFDVQIWLMRVISILLLLPLPWLGHATAARITRDEHVIRAAAIAPMAVPGLMIRNGPIINNDGLLTLLGAVIVYYIVRIVDDDDSWTTALGVGLASGAAMLTKAFGLMLLAAVATAYLWQLIRVRSNPARIRRTLLSGSLAGGVAVLMAGWWYIRNLLAVGSVRVSASPRPEVEGVVPDWDHWAAQIVQVSWRSFWGGDYVLNDRQHLAILTLLILVTGVLVAFAIFGRPERRDLVIAALLPLLFIIVVTYASQGMNGYAERGRIATHGRYLYAGLTGITTAMAIGLGQVFRRGSRWLPLGVTVVSGALYIVGFYSFLLRNWGPQGASVRNHVWALLVWSPPKPWFVVGTGLAFAVSGLWLAWICWPSAAGHPEREPVEGAAITA